MLTRLSTDDIAMRERPSYWNYLVSSVLGRLHTEPQRAGAFNGSLAYSTLSSIPIAHVASSPVYVLRQESFIDDPKEDFYKINFIRQGTATLSQQNHTAELEPGDWTIYDNTRPYELKCHSDYRQLVFLVPRHQLLNRLPTIDLWLARPFSSRKGMGKLLFEFVSNALQEGDKISAGAQSHTAQMMLDLLLLSLTESADQPLALPHPTRVTQLKQFIATHLHDPDLTVEMLANNLHLSKRYIQKLFADQNSTVNRYIWQERITKCKIDLANPLLANMPIRDIAFSWGFRSNAHFSRMFKQVSGQTPKTYRNQNLPLES